jgi:RsiW-degrading membrane proteinase PrsW (M82 family)
MEYAIGAGLAVAVCVFALLTGFDRDRVFYPTVVAVNATYYVLFAAMGSSTRTLILESVMAGVFFALAVAGFKKSLWVIVAALAGHGVFDLFQQRLIQNPGVPVWWPGFCLAFDVLAAALVAMLLMRRSGFAGEE